LAEAECRVKRGQAEAGLQGVGQFPTEHVAAETSPSRRPDRGSRHASEGT
jgi:hypothetical protein